MDDLVEPGSQLGCFVHGWYETCGHTDATCPRYSEVEKTPERAREKTEIELLEPHSARMVKARELVQRYADGDVEYDEMLDTLEHTFREHDRESFDCHSFMLSLLKREMGIPVEIAPKVTIPNIKRYKYSLEWEEAYEKELTKMLQRPDGQRYQKQLMQFTENMHENSEHIPLPDLRLTDDASLEAGKDIAREIVRRVIEKFSEAPQSSVILFSKGSGDTFREVHTSVVLCLDASGEDLLVLEKGQIGSSVTVKKLTKIVEVYMFAISLKDIELNVCKRPAGEMYFHKK